MKTINVAINGAGRIGRAFLKTVINRPEINLVAINDLGSIDNIAYLLKYDTAYGPSGLDIKVSATKDAILVNGKEIKYLSEKEPANLPWGKLAVDVVVESTGFFASFDKAQAHVTAGAKRVVITAPVKDDPAATVKGNTVLMGINEPFLETGQLSSNASCTTNAGSPLIAILHEQIGIEKALLNTVHSYTASQSIVDGPNKKDFREGRAAAQNIVPSSTGAAIAVTQVLPSLKNKFDGISIRVPTVVGSIVDITFLAKRNTTKDEVNAILKSEAAKPRWKGIFTVTEEELVSRDIVGNTHASIADLSFTRVVDGNLVKVLAWYDNEMGYTHTLVEHVIKAGSFIK
jgi:glyceraldehyde 3-phosphate dehydrogenase